MNDLPKNDVLKNLKQQFLNGNLVEYTISMKKRLPRGRSHAPPAPMLTQCAWARIAAICMCLTG